MAGTIEDIIEYVEEEVDEEIREALGPSLKGYKGYRECNITRAEYKNAC